MSGAAHRWTAPVGLIAVAVVVALDTRAYPPSLVPAAPGPAFFPRLLAAILFGIGLLLAVRAWSGGPAGAEGEPGGEEREPVETVEAGGPGSVGRLDLLRVAGGVAAIAGFLLAAPRTDTFVLLPVLIASLMALMGERRTGPLLAIPLAFTLFVYLVFYRAFGVLVPTRLF